MLGAFSACGVSTCGESFFLGDLGGGTTDFDPGPLAFLMDFGRGFGFGFGLGFRV